MYLNEIHHSCWVTIFNIRRAIGPWSDGICDDVMDRDVHIHSSKLKINTEKCIFLSGKLKLKLNHYSFCCYCHAKTKWIWQNDILHDFINIKKGKKSVPYVQLWGSSKRQSSYKSYRKLQSGSQFAGLPVPSISSCWSTGVHPISAVSPTAPDLLINKQINYRCSAEKLYWRQPIVMVFLDIKLMGKMDYKKLTDTFY